MAKIVLILLIIMATLTTRLQDVITYDESYTFYAYAYDPFVALLRYTLPNNHQLHSLSIWLTTSLVGDSIIAIRLPVVFATLLTLSMFFRIAGQVYNRRVALILVLLLTIQPLFFQYALESRGYMLGNFLLLVLIVMIQHRRITGRLRTYLLLLLTALLLITLPTLIIPVMACLLWGWSFHHHMLYRKFVVLPVIVGCLVGGLFYLFPLTQGLFSEFSQLFGYNSLHTFLEAFVSQMVVASPASLIFVILLIMAILYQHPANRIRNLFTWMIVITALTLMVQFVVSGSLVFPRNLIYLLPIGVLVSGRFFDRWMVHRPIGVWSIVSVMVVYLVWMSQPSPSQTDYLLQDLNQHTTSSDYVVFGCCQDGPMRYELEKADQLSLMDGTKSYTRLILLSFSTDLETLIMNYNLSVDINDCNREVWEHFEPYICRIDHARGDT